MSHATIDLVDALAEIVSARALAPLQHRERSRLGRAVDAIRREARAAARGVEEAPPPTPAEVREACARECEERAKDCERLEPLSPETVETRRRLLDGKTRDRERAAAYRTAAALCRALRLPGEEP